jgi:D-lactate dehydrogenase (cytochrome)
MTVRYTIAPVAMLPEALAGLADVFGDRLTSAPSVLDLHGRDESSYPPCRPDAVAFARTTAEVSAALALCTRYRVPVVPFGVGTSLEGQVLPVAGGLSLDLSGMDRILEINGDDLDCRVEPGVRKDQLNGRLRDHGLFFAIDPGADATIGGMAATGASGTMTVRYGTIRENVLGLEVVLADGSVVRTGSRARKSSAGYDLTHLFLGSEGTLGVITEICVRLHGIPERIAAARVSFPTVQAATDTAIATIQSGIPIARCELLDTLMVQASNAFSQLDEPERPALFFEFHGSEATLREHVAAVEAIAVDNGGSAFRWATRTEDRTRLWDARHDAYFAQLALRPGCRMVATDVCVPVSRLAECIAETNADIAGMPFPIPIVGHVADGNFHCGLLIDPDDAGERAQAKAFTARLTERAVAMGGTCTGEHGVGLGKIASLQKQYPPATIALMQTLKQAIDPLGIMNPGKLFDVSPP